MDLFLNIAQTLIAGILSVFSPCIIPVLPIIMVGREKDSRLRPFYIVSGLATMFIILGVISSAFGYLLIGKIDYLEKIGAVIIFIFGATMLLDINPFKKITIFNKLIADKTQDMPDFILGLSFGLLWIPCTGPILSSVLTLVAAKASILYGIMLLTIYSIGFALPMLGFAYFSQFFRTKSRVLMKNPKYINWVSGSLLILFSLYTLIF